jgi:hypothetical protein
MSTDDTAPRPAKEAPVARIMGAASPFFVENLTGNNFEVTGPWPAELVIGVLGDVRGHSNEACVTCHLMTDGEIDFEIERLKQQLDAIGREAKKLLIKHRKYEEKYFSKRKAE